MEIIGNYCRRIKSWVMSLLTGGSVDAKFNSVNIEAGEAYKQATEIILRIKDLNTFCGVDAGKVTTGNHNNFMGYGAGRFNTTGNSNNFMGYGAGYTNTTGYYNNFMGCTAGYANTTGYSNNFMGHGAGRFNTTGHSNNFMGYAAGRLNTIGYYNNFMGYEAGRLNTAGHSNNFMGCVAGYANTTGCYNNFMGYGAGRFNTTGNSNNFLGYKAGFYETGSNNLFIDNATRTDEADGRVKALIYGIFDAAVANQLVRLNAKKVEMPALGDYINDAAAAAGGIAIGGLYRNGNIVQVRIA